MIMAAHTIHDHITLREAVLVFVDDHESDSSDAAPLQTGKRGVAQRFGKETSLPIGGWFAMGTSTGSSPLALPAR